MQATQDAACSGAHLSPRTLPELPAKNRQSLLDLYRPSRERTCFINSTTASLLQANEQSRNLVPSLVNILLLPEPLEVCDMRCCSSTEYSRNGHLPAPKSCGVRTPRLEVFPSAGASASCRVVSPALLFFKVAHTPRVALMESAVDPNPPSVARVVSPPRFSSSASCSARRDAADLLRRP